MEGDATWMRYKDIELQNGKTTNKLVEHYGTRAELLEYIREKATEWSFHRWVKNWMKWQSKLNIATFDGATEILVLTDYAAVYEMKGRTMRTCEHGTTCNQLVALVLHSPSETLPGEERNVVIETLGSSTLTMKKFFFGTNLRITYTNFLTVHIR